jgi:hypothetical protein
MQRLQGMRFRGFLRSTTGTTEAYGGEGLLFHMEGLWQLRVGVMANGLMERIVFDIDMEP